jgi:catechol 2,3-dioxygenase-like lactoylglutathione lyase family enzyme
MKLRALNHVSFAVTDLAKTQRFAEDFGLSVVSNDGERLYMRTSGGDAWCYTAVKAPARGFLGLGFLVESRADLEEAVSKHGASPIRELTSPGGGQAVTLKTPDDITVDLVFGISRTAALPPEPSLNVNSPGAMGRLAKPQTHRPLGPARPLRLGHIGLFTKDFGKTVAWLEAVLGLKCTDVMHAPGNPNAAIVGFYRIDRGAAWVDHHTIFLGQGKAADLHHVSFEVQDYEAQFRTHRWLQQRGWELNWGVGRHPLGSHVFDVWFDPDRYRFETFSDTDLVNDDHKTGRYDVRTQDLDMWSSDPPDRYFT